MKTASSPRLFPFLTLGAGGIGFALYRWLLTGGMDEKGLLVSGYPAGTLLFILTALVLAALFFLLKSLPPVSKYRHLFPPSYLNALGCVFGAAALIYAAVTEGLSGTDIFSRLLLPVGIAGGIALLCMAYFRSKGLRPSFYLTCIPVVYMILHLITLCRICGTEPQLLLFFFPLMACVFLLLTFYQHCALVIHSGSRWQFLFYNQAALFFCCLSLGTQAWRFFLGMLLWTAADMCSLRHRQPSTQQKEA